MAHYLFDLFNLKTCEENLVNLTEQVPFSDKSTSSNPETERVVNDVQSIYEIFMLLLLPINVCLNALTIYVFGRYQRSILACFMVKLYATDMVYEISFMTIIIIHKFHPVIWISGNQILFVLSLILMLSMCISMQHINCVHFLHIPYMTYMLYWFTLSSKRILGKLKFTYICLI